MSAFGRKADIIFDALTADSDHPGPDADLVRPDYAAVKACTASARPADPSRARITGRGKTASCARSRRILARRWRSRDASLSARDASDLRTVTPNHPPRPNDIGVMACADR